jgi:serine/threonine-protein kinase
MMTAALGTMGTPAYMAPEIIMARGEIDRRADVYALGCVAYFILTGQRVFDGDTPMQALIDHVHTVPTPPSRRSTLLIPPELDDIVMQCLEKDPAKRPQDAMKLRRMLETCQTCNAWSSAKGAEWWRKNLPDLAAPLTFLDEPSALVH